MKLFWAPQTRAQRAIWMLPESRNLGAYAERCAARPAHRRAVEISSG